MLELVDQQLADLEMILDTLEMRFIGSSVLIIYEGDEARLEEALERQSKLPIKPPIHFVDPDHVEGDVSDEEEDEEDDEESDSSDDSLDGTRADEKLRKKCPPVTVKLIDFAHTRLAEGEGPDQGVLKGIRTLRALIHGRMAEVRAKIAEA